MNSDKRYFPLLRPLQSLAKLYEYLTNLPIFNISIPLLTKGFIDRQTKSGQDINVTFTVL
jgi:hypothetical protein